mgnify:CR=1 FL=1
MASRSTHKISEIRRILEVVPNIRVLDLEEMCIPYDPSEEELEQFDTFEENATSKASYFRRVTGLPTVADDSGLEVDLLGGAPGVRSKRFAPTCGREGIELDQANNAHLLALLGDAPFEERTGRYVCVAALERRKPERTGEQPTVVRGVASGLILDVPRGSGGFGYDPLFLDKELGRTFAEISPSEKNARSHRGRAFQALAERLMAAEVS